MAAKKQKTKTGRQRSHFVQKAAALTDEDLKDFDEKFSHMSDKMKFRRQQFCREYIKDFNAGAAVQRMGYLWGAGAPQKGWAYLQEPYTQHFLAKLMREIDEKSIIDRNTVILGLLREANTYGEEASHSARISAFRSLAKILGMEITKVEGSMNVDGGVMAVPFSGSLEEWEANCKSAQANLKKKARE